MDDIISKILPWLLISTIRLWKINGSNFVSKFKFKYSKPCFYNENIKIYKEFVFLFILSYVNIIGGNIFCTITINYHKILQLQLTYIKK